MRLIERRVSVNSFHSGQSSTIHCSLVKATLLHFMNIGAVPCEVWLRMYSACQNNFLTFLIFEDLYVKNMPHYWFNSLFEYIFIKIHGMIWEALGDLAWNDLYVNKVKYSIIMGLWLQN